MTTESNSQRNECGGQLLANWGEQNGRRVMRYGFTEVQRVHRRQVDLCRCDQHDSRREPLRSTAVALAATLFQHLHSYLDVSLLIHFVSPP